MEIYELLNKLIRTEDNLIQCAKDIDMVINHIVQLLTDAAGLFMQGCYAKAAFLSITACEEVAKAHIGSFTDGQHPEKTGRNMFRDHKTKHALPSIADWLNNMGDNMGQAGKWYASTVSNILKRA